MTIPPLGDTAGGRGPAFPDPVITPWTPTAPGLPDGGGADGGLEFLDAGPGGGDVGVPDSCATHCDCPGGWDCINARCQLGAMAILCCGGTECPTGETCWTREGVRGSCGL